MAIEGSVSNNICAAERYYNKVLAERCRNCNPKKKANCNKHSKAIQYNGIKFITTCLSNEEIAEIHNLLNER